MRDPLKKIFRSRKHAFSDFWFDISETRFVLCLIIGVFSLFTSDALRFRYIFVSTAIYAAFILALGFIDPSTLRRKRIRALPALIDVVFISFLIYLTGGQDSIWFLLYLFPIISISRYLSYEGSVPLMALTIVAYVLAVQLSSPRVNYYSLTLTCLVFLGIAVTAGNITRRGQRKETKLLDMFNEIDNEILNNSATNQVLRLILRKALESTRSDVAQLRILSVESNSVYTITVQSESYKAVWDIDDLTKQCVERANKSKKQFSLHKIKGGADQPKSASFVPLVINDEVKAIMALYSQDRFHYAPTEENKLKSFAQLLGIALKNYDMYQKITDSENEKKARLKMLYEIGEQLKIEKGLEDIFKKAVEVMYNQLTSEEASLFIVDERNKNLIKKVAVKGPNEEIAEKLLEVEKPYKPGESWVGRIFRDQKHVHNNDVPLSVTYQNEYSEILPSQQVCHYIGVPLILGKEALGVIRVINKRAPTYSTENNNFKLSERGFDNEDLELMQTIASQVAAAIRSAKFIEVQRYHHELLENSPDPIIVLNEKGRVKIFNKACEKIWGVRAEHVIDQSVKNYYESESHAREIGELLARSPDRRIHDYPAKIKALSGEIIPINLSASLLFDNHGKKVGSIGVFKDMRETIRLQEEKTNAEKLATLGKLAHTVGHEIKHNIATGLNYIDTLAYEFSDDEELSEIFQDIQETLNEAVDKFQNMLMIGRPKPPAKTLTNSKDIIGRVEETFRRRATAKNIEVFISHPDGAHELEADVEQLKQVLTNLFDNSLDAIAAKRFVGEKGRIELLAQISNGDLHINWRDNGCGISPERVPQMFTPFTTTKPTGNGLGLFIIRKIIENHGGQISVESIDGRGTSFKIVLPLFHENDAVE
jgi:PAS domain S-box-containing protein